MPHKKLIDAGWRSYAEHVLPAGASKVQTQETKRAFYAGAVHLFGALGMFIGLGDVSEDAGLAIMESVDEEIKAFLRDVKSGRA